jgi:REP element-mobilizing transposase RayT
MPPDVEPDQPGVSNLIGYFDPQQPIGELHGNLPHWRQEGVTYFVTFRLADSIPKSTLDLWIRQRDDWLLRHPEPRSGDVRREYYRLFVEQFQKWLDAGHGSCVLGQPAIRNIVSGALPCFEPARYVLREWVIMPNHVHVIVTPLNGHNLSDIVHSWKSFTANKINRLLGRAGALWQKEPFDHIVRGPDQLARIEQYIHGNPRNLPADRYTLRCLHRQT